MASGDSTYERNVLKFVQDKMLTRGPACMKTFQRRFRIMDDNKNRRLNLNEFKTGLQDIGVRIKDEDYAVAFKQFDKDGSGEIDIDEFIYTMRPNMNALRKSLVTDCFMMMDKTGDGVIGVEDLVGNYNATHHPKYKSGDMSETDVYREFLKSFEAEEHVDGQVTLDEFQLYYCCLSASIDKDAYFQLMMRNSWKHLDKDGKLFAADPVSSNRKNTAFAF